MKILIAGQKGFCAGVKRAIDIVYIVLKHYDNPVYVKHEIVHNKHVIDELKNKGVTFIEDIKDVPDGAILIYSAHGVSRSIKKQANLRNIKTFDAACPLVSKIHTEVLKASANGWDCILVGHHGHPEVEGIIGHFDTDFGGAIYLVEKESDIENLEVANEDNLLCVTQTTLSVTETQEIHKSLKNKFANIIYPKKDDICYATQNRQDALIDLAHKCDLVFVIGSETSSNTQRLFEISTEICQTYLIDTVKDIQEQWLTCSKINNIGITAGASAPQIVIDEVVDSLENRFDCKAQTLSGVSEEVVFSLPKELKLLSL